MDTRKKACPNEQCKTYKIKKYAAKINYCPECGTKLIYVCKSHNCYKPLDTTINNHSYCFECDAKRKDNKDKIIGAGKAGAALVGAAFVEQVKKGGKEVAKEVAEKGVGIAKKVIKK